MHKASWKTSSCPILRTAKDLPLLFPHLFRYDGGVRKLLLALLLFLLFSAGMLTPKQVLAACSDPNNYTLEPTTTTLDTKTLFSITSATNNCFGRGIPGPPHYVYSYPEEQEGSLNVWRPILYNNASSFNDGGSLHFEEDFPSETGVYPTLRPYGRNKTWILLVCAVPVSNPVHCVNNPSNRVARLSFRMTPPPTPTPRPPTPIPADLPRVQQPAQCIYQRGSEFDIIVENLIPNAYHVWWWRGESRDKGRIFIPKATLHTLSLKSGDTNFPDEKKTLCVHKAKIPLGESCKEGMQNSATFLFKRDPPKGDTSCPLRVKPPPEHIPNVPPECKIADAYTQCGNVPCNEETWEANNTVSVVELSCSEEPTTRYDCKPLGARPGECGNGVECPVCPDTHPKYDKTIKSCCAKDSKEGECKSPIDPIRTDTCEAGIECGLGIGCGLGTRGPCGKKILPGGTVTNDYECDTAIGGIDITPAGFVKTIFGTLLGLSGGIALLLIIFSGYKLIFSRGDPERVQGAKETLTSAIVGLLFIIFSLVILEVIGVDILKIPGLGN